MRRDLASALRDPHPRPGPAAARPARTPRGRAPRRLRRRRARSQALRDAAAGAPVPRLPRPRGPRPLGGALVQAGPRRRHPAAPGRAAHQHRGPPVRPGLRRADRARLPRRRRRPGPRHRPGPAPDAALLRARPGRRRVAAARASGTTCRRAELAAALSVLVFEARRPDDASPPRVPGRPGPRGDRGDGPAVGPSSTRWSATTTSTSCASPTPASPGRPTAGPRATSSTTCSASSELAAGDFVRWMKQLLDLAGQVADAAGDGPLRDDRPRGGRGRLRRGVVAYSGARRRLSRRSASPYGVGDRRTRRSPGSTACRPSPARRAPRPAPRRRRPG